MTALLSILGLLALWAILANLERLPWPPQHSGLYSSDPDYLAAVVRESQNYLAMHTNMVPQIRVHVAAMGQAAQQRLGGMTR